MRRVHYAWVVAAVGFVTLITAAGFRSTSGVLIVPLQNDFGWSRATIGVAVAINLVLYGLGRPFSAAFVERFGVRRVTWFGGYGWAFGSAGLLCLFASGLVMQIGREPHAEPSLAVA